ncbi:MAG: hypothetical protein IKY12_04960 [Clostridia bacterium]|nr:hypothetical protein [Clostridia bacterium]
MENFDIIPIVNINEDIAELNAKLETIKTDIRIEETMREAFSKDLTPTILRRKVRYKRVNGVKQEFTEVTVYQTELNELIEAVKTPARVKQNYDKLQKLGAQLKRETSQTAIYKRCVEAEAEIKRLKTENLLLQAKVTERDREIAEIYAQSTEPYIDYEEQTFDLEI